MEILSGICIGATILTIWFLSDWKIHLLEFFGIHSHAGNVDEIICEKLDYGLKGYTLGAMLICPFCIGFWLALVLSIFFGNLFLIYIGQLILFGLVKKLNAH